MQFVRVLLDQLNFGWHLTNDYQNPSSPLISSGFQETLATNTHAKILNQLSNYGFVMRIFSLSIYMMCETVALNIASFPLSLLSHWCRPVAWKKNLPLWACEIGHMCLPMQRWRLWQRGKGEYVRKSAWVRADLPLCVCESVRIWLLAPVWLQKCAYV